MNKLETLIKLAELIGPDLSSEPDNSETNKLLPTKVLVCTDKRGVVFGTTTDPDARPITLQDARMCLYWSKDVGGVFGLAENGPTAGCKISAVCPCVKLEGVTAVFDASSAASAWESAPVQGRE